MTEQQLLREITVECNRLATSKKVEIFSKSDPKHAIVVDVPETSGLIELHKAIIQQLNYRVL